jgi:hypothetical protein
MLATDQAATRPPRMISATLQTSLGLGLRYGSIGGMALHARTMATKIPPIEATAACSGLANGNMTAKASDSASKNLHCLTNGSFSFLRDIRPLFAREGYSQSAWKCVWRKSYGGELLPPRMHLRVVPFESLRLIFGTGGLVCKYPSRGFLRSLKSRPLRTDPKATFPA